MIRAASLSAFALALAACSSASSSPVPRSTSQPSLPPAPNYASARAWLSRSGADTLDLVPKNGGFSDLEAAANVDVFYLYPTTAFVDDVYPPSTGENAAYDDVLAEGLAYEIGASQAGTFNATGRIFAPLYRQVYMDEWLKKNPTAASASGAQIAYDDVRNAFEYYLQHDNHGRPIVLVGHSQGSMLNFRLLKDEFDGKPLMKQLIAAYIPGQAVDATFYRHFSHVRPCESPTATGCVVSWGSFQQGIAPSDLNGFISVSPYFRSGNGDYGQPSTPVTASANLVTWSNSAASAPARSDLGPLQMLVPYPPLYYPHTRAVYPMGTVTALRFSSQTYGQTVQPQAVGFFVNPKPPAADFAAFVPLHLYDVNFDGVWHLYDFNLFWTNIRQNARDRSNAYLAAHGDRTPLVSGPVRLVVKAGSALHYGVRTVNSATSFRASGLPAELSIDRATGTISGVPKAGVYAVVVTATNASGASEGEFALEVR
ncbi:MAG: DUF3089 domain-containing protein [Candidatus Eremiobacteraeota bacterium]|nr:DUF3089 domain-containing protein [Candidatus Eremiobacteraeota bacterium]